MKFKFILSIIIGITLLTLTSCTNYNFKISQENIDDLLKEKGGPAILYFDEYGNINSSSEQYYFNENNEHDFIEKLESSLNNKKDILHLPNIPEGYKFKNGNLDYRPEKEASKLNIKTERGKIDNENVELIYIDNKDKNIISSYSMFYKNESNDTILINYFLSKDLEKSFSNNEYIEITEKDGSLRYRRGFEIEPVTLYSSIDKYTNPTTFDSSVVIIYSSNINADESKFFDY